MFLRRNLSTDVAQESFDCYCAGIFRMMLRRNFANDVAKLRIRKEKDFNITDFFSDKISFL